MNDSISRETALKALEEISYGLWEIDIPSPTVPEYIEHHEQVQSVMKLVDKWARKIQAAMPVSEEPTEPQWIPCKERLPEENGEYLVTREAKGIYNFVEIVKKTNVSGDIARDIVAWMPLPEPYEG